MFGTWMKLALDTSMLALETQQVIGLRFLKLTLGGPAASREANRMVAEKVDRIRGGCCEGRDRKHSGLGGQRLSEKGAGESPTID